MATEVITYRSEKAMRSDIRSKERKGWTVLSTQRVPQGWSVGKTVVLGALFLPAALLGKKGDLFQVTYQYEKKVNKVPRHQYSKRTTKIINYIFLAFIIVLAAIGILMMFP